jgi:hemerythrin
MKLNPSEIPEVAMPFMQEAHLEEVAMLNELYDLFDKSRQGEEVSGLAEKIEALVVHTHAHFERENEKMLALSFPPYPVHKQAHDEYLNDMDAVVAAWRESGELVPVMVFFEEATPAWLQQHISTMDFVTANFFAMCEGS